MDEPLAVHPFADTGPVEEIGGGLLEDAGPDAVEHVRDALPLDDHVVDAGKVEELPEQQSEGPGADDRDLRAAPRQRLLPSSTIAVRPCCDPLLRGRSDARMLTGDARHAAAKTGDATRARRAARNSAPC